MAVATRLRTRVGAVLLAALLAACATAPSAPERVTTGRFAATATRDDARQSVSGRFTLAVAGPRRTLDIATPVGTTIARVEIEPARTTVTGPQLETLTGADPDALIERVLGWRLPVAGLADWLDGRPDPARPARTVRDGERLTIEQDGWTVIVEETSPVTGKPRRLALLRPERGAEPALTVRLIVDDPAT
jgi:outer membrane lipoprotein LolB